MHRNGILPKEIEKAIVLIKNNKNIFIEGICSHFADADGDDSDFTTNQIEKWNNLVEIWKKIFQKQSIITYQQQLVVYLQIV